MKFVNVDAGNTDHIGFLYWLLSERTLEQSISHKAMPSFSEHTVFVRSHPYHVWWLLKVGDEFVGSLYVTHQNEIGIFILRSQQRKGYARGAVLELNRRHPGRLFANVNPANEASRRFWEAFGGKLIQVTYELPVHSG